MNLLQKAVSYLARSIGLTDPRLYRALGSVPTSSGETVNTASVLGLAAAWACVNLLAGTIASLPLMVYRTRGGARTVASDHPLYRILHDSPNADQTALDFWEFVCASLELHGNAYAEVVRARNGRIIALGVPITPELVTVRRVDSGALEYEWVDQGRRIIAGQDRVLHIRGFGGNPLGGLSTLSAGRQSFGLAQAIERASGDTFRNGVRPSGLLKTADTLTIDQRKQAEELLQEKFAGAINAGRPMLLDRGMDWVQLSISPEDAQMLQSRAFSVEEVCRFFGVPPFMVGHTEKTTSWGTGLEQQTLGFQKFTLRRRLKRIEQALEKQLLSVADRLAGITIEFNLEGLLRADSAARASFYQLMLTNGVMTINEVRSLENLPPVEGGDEPRMQMQNVPITQAGQQQIQTTPGGPQ
ncbi:MAG: phage portal protein [Sphingomonadales bacterium]|nr:phage portal protein [Sphingomonadales bacterium]